MHSITKVTLTPADAQAIVADAFGNAARIHAFQELTDGYFNAAYVVEVAGGPKCVLKVAPSDAVRVLRYEQDIMHAEVAVMRLVGQQTQMPVPGIYRFDPSRRLIDSPYFAMEFVPGTPLNKMRATLSPEAQEALDRETGVYLRQMNDIVGPSFGYAAPTAARYTSWADAFLGMVDAILADGKEMQVGLPRPYDVLRRQIRHRAAVLEGVSTPHLVHWDLWDGNIFVHPDSVRIAGIVDFERALWGDPLMEFQFHKPEAPPGFDAGYGRAMLDTPTKQHRRVLYNIYFCLILIIECYYRQYETDNQERWARPWLERELARLDNIPDAGST